jgi:hypothetical protein
VVKVRSLNIEIWDLPALLNRPARTCGTDQQCGFHDPQDHAMTIELFNRVNNLMLDIWGF